MSFSTKVSVEVDYIPFSAYVMERPAQTNHAMDMGIWEKASRD